MNSISKEEDFYAQAMQEIEAGNCRLGLWAKAFAEAEGNEAKAKALYLKLRVQAEFQKEAAMNREQSAQGTNSDQRQFSPPEQPLFARDGHGPGAHPSTPKVFLNKLKSGDYGLAKTYWLFGVLTNSIAGLFVKVLVPVAPNLGALLILVCVAYNVIAMIGVWRAADSYKGEPLWAILAKIAVLGGSVLNFVALGSIPLIFMN